MLVEDHAGYREVITRALKREATIELISQFSTAEFALRTLEHSKGDDLPDIVLLDLNLPKMSGLEAIPWIKDYSPDSKILIITQSDMEADVLKAIQSGASGYLLKSSTAKQVVEGIQMVMNGGAPLDAGVARFILDTLKSKLPKDKPKADLSNRELEVLTLLAEGLARKEIAERLGISTYTIIYHIKHIFQKLEAINTPAAVSNAYKSGILPTNKTSL
jgi:DNA-binding NarL/FixJ family response regulator